MPTFPIFDPSSLLNQFFSKDLTHSSPRLDGQDRVWLAGLSHKLTQRKVWRPTATKPPPPTNLKT